MGYGVGNGCHRGVIGCDWSVRSDFVRMGSVSVQSPLPQVVFQGGQVFDPIPRIQVGDGSSFLTGGRG